MQDVSENVQIQHENDRYVFLFFVRYTDFFLSNDGKQVQEEPCF